MIEKARLRHSFRKKASEVVATKVEQKTQSVHSVCLMAVRHMPSDPKGRSASS